MPLKIYSISAQTFFIPPRKWLTHKIKRLLGCNTVTIILFFISVKFVMLLLQVVEYLVHDVETIHYITQKTVIFHIL